MTDKIAPVTADEVVDQQQLAEQLLAHAKAEGFNSLPRGGLNQVTKRVLETDRTSQRETGRSAFDVVVWYRFGGVPGGVVGVQIRAVGVGGVEILGCDPSLFRLICQLPRFIARGVWVVVAVLLFGVESVDLTADSLVIHAEL